MSSTYSTRKRLEKQNPGENNNAWGGYLNTNAIDLVDECFGVVCVNMTGAGDLTLTTNNGASDEGRRSQIILTGVPTSNVRLFVPAQQSFYLVRNKMTGTKKVTLTNAGGTNGVDFSGTGSGAEQGLVLSDGTNVREVFRTASAGALTGFTSTVWTVVSDAPTDATGGAINDLLPFLDVSEGNALNKVTVQKFFDNALAGMTAKTTVGSTDQYLILDADTSTAKFVTAANSYKSINALTEDTQPDGSSDYGATYDNSAAGGKKVKLRNFNSPGVLSKTANYTVTDSDRNCYIEFSGLAADVTLTLPAASGRAGFLLYVANVDANDTTGFNVTIDPNASETLDGVTSRKMSSGCRVTLLCDGTNWKTIAGVYRYFSGDQTITVNVTVAVPHGLGVRPRKLWTEFRCVTPEFGYAAGEITQGTADNTDGGYGLGVTAILNSTSVDWKYPATGFIISYRNSANQTLLTNANWKFRLYAET
jgi:hypothetical protein